MTAKTYNLGPVKPDCTFPHCNRPQYGNGLCAAHNTQRARGKELTPLRVGRNAKPCAVCTDGTPSVLKTSGEPLCRRHHAIWLRHGDARTITRNDVRRLATDTLSDMVASRDRSECWTDWADWPCWEGLDGFGGAVTVGYPTVGTTRMMHVAMEADGRPKPPAPGNHGLHSCDNKMCLNPAHLRWGTHEENMQDIIDSRNYCAHCSHCNPS